MNACIDTLGVYRSSVANQPQSSGLIAPHSLRLLPLFILAIMKHVCSTQDLWLYMRRSTATLFSITLPFVVAGVLGKKVSERRFARIDGYKKILFNKILPSSKEVLLQEFFLAIDVREFSLLDRLHPNISMGILHTFSKHSLMCCQELVIVSFILMCVSKAISYLKERLDPRYF